MLKHEPLGQILYSLLYNNWERHVHITTYYNRYCCFIPIIVGIIHESIVHHSINVSVIAILDHFIYTVNALSTWVSSIHEHYYIHKPVSSIAVIKTFHNANHWYILHIPFNYCILYVVLYCILITTSKYATQIIN